MPAGTIADSLVPSSARSGTRRGHQRPPGSSAAPHPVLLLALRGLCSVAQLPLRGALEGGGSEAPAAAAGASSSYAAGSVGGNSSAATSTGVGRAAGQAATVEAGRREERALELTDERLSAISDKAPQKPVGVVEGTTWSMLIAAALGVVAYVLYLFLVSFVLTPVVQQCFNHTLDRLKVDPRVNKRVGSAEEMRAFGSSSRAGRQNIAHQVYKDINGREHVKLQFYIAGPRATAQVQADMYKDVTGHWAYTYLWVDAYTGASPQPQRMHIVAPRV